MGMVSTKEKDARIQAAYDALPEPRPFLCDYAAFRAEHGEAVVERMDPQHVIQAAVGAGERLDNRKHNRSKRWGH